MANQEWYKVIMANQEWNTKLRSAAKIGDLKAFKFCLEKGADIYHETPLGMTMLMIAAMAGHLELCRFILDKGCKIDAAMIGKMTALMWAAMTGHVEVCRLLINKRCRIDIKNNSGQSALHIAAIHGHVDVTRCLIEEGGFSAFDKAEKGKTPYDLAAAELKDRPRNTEVMDYLKSVMSKDVRHKNMQETQTVEELVPAEIRLMTDKKSVPLYLKLLESGSEKKREIRLVIVGKKGAGKTSLTKRLFSEENIDSTSTNGIDIHTIRCKAMSDDGIWNKLNGNNTETEMNARLLKHYKRTIEASIKEGDHQSNIDNKFILYRRIDALKGSEESHQQPNKSNPSVTTKSQVEHPKEFQSTNQSLKQAEREIETMLKSNVDLQDKEEYATLFVWDFAGDEEFYHTHQTFLSPDAIYLVITKLNEADNKKSQDVFQLWMDSIHCYSKLEEKKRNSDDNKKKSGDLDPPIVIVGTWKDAVISDTEEIDDACRKTLYKYAENMSENERRHIREEYFISNTDDDPSVFQQIRENILNLARKMRTWNINYPLKFIQLEKQLQEKKKMLPIISFSEMQRIAIGTPNPLNDDELILFLEFHHEIRAFVYFKDLPSYIILDTQWLSDAFRCIVTAKEFRAISIRNRTKWDELYSRGKLHSEVLEDIFNKTKNNFSKYKDHILNVMEKFDIIIRPKISENAEENPCYYVPCLIKTESQCDVLKLFNVTNDNCKRSTWLCFKFSYQPPYLMNHLVAALSRIYKISEVVVPNQKENTVALFGDTAVFELQNETKLRKLMVMKFTNCIQLQVLEFGTSDACIIKGGLYKDIGDFVTDELEKIIHERFKMSNVEFEKKLECGLTKPELVKGSYEFSEKHFTEYRCGTCADNHKYVGEWSRKENRSKSDCYEKKEGQNGLVLIVNFMFRGERKMRQGSEIDVTNLTEFFTKIGYEVKCAPEDMTKEELQNYFQEIEKSYLTEKSKNYHSFIGVIMSHGNKDGIITKDNQKITVGEIMKEFKNKSNGKFNGRPKLFLIQACRGHQKQELVVVSDGVQIGDTGRKEESTEICQRLIPSATLNHDQPSGSTEICVDAHDHLLKLTPIDADIMVLYATTPGFVAFRNPCNGTCFIKAFLSVAEDKYRDEHIEEILTQVRNKLATDPEYAPQSGNRAGKCQMAMLESTSTKKFYL